MNAKFMRKNLIASIVSMVIQFLQSLWITSYIQRIMGVEAYGYISVIVNIVNMAGIITVALTSVCSRYMVIELETKNKENINRLFNTIYYSLLLISVVCLCTFGIMSFNVTAFMNVSPEYVQQVSILLIIVGIDFVLQLLQVPYLSIFYFEEKIYYTYYTTMFSNIFKVIVVVICFTAYEPVVWAAYLGSIFINVGALGVYNCYVRKKYFYIKKTLKYFKTEKLKEILSSGIWVSLSKLAATLLSSCSTYLVNILIGVYMAGIYGSVSQIQSILSFITVAIVNVFLPRMFKLYAVKGEKNGLIKYTRESLKVLSILLGIVTGGLIVYGAQFMSLWISEEYLEYKWLLSISVCYLALSYSAEMINQLLITINKTKVPAIVSAIAGIANIILAIFFDEMFKAGIYGIALAQLIVLCFRSGIWMPIYAAKCVKQKWHIFMVKQMACFKSISMTVIVGYFINCAIQVDSWLTLILAGGFTGILVLGLLIVVDSDVRVFLKKII